RQTVSSTAAWNTRGAGRGTRGAVVMSASPEELDNRWKRREGILAFLCLGAMFPLCLLAERTGKLPLWLINLALAAAFLALIGKATTRIWWGALIDDRNALSLTRLQITLWTILIGSAYITASTTNALAGEDAAVPTRAQLAEAEQDVKAAQEAVDKLQAQLKAG